MSMTRKDYQMIATCIRVRKGWYNYNKDIDPAYRQAIDELAEDLAARFKEDNIKFDRAKFLNACYFG